MVAVMADPEELRDFPPGLVERILESYDHWPWLRTPRDLEMPSQPLNASSDGRIERRAAERASVRQALLWLAVAYPMEHDAVVGYWMEHERIDEIAAWQGCAESTVYGRIRRGVRRMSYRLGYVESRGIERDEP